MLEGIQNQTEAWCEGYLFMKSQPTSSRNLNKKERVFQTLYQDAKQKQ